LKGAIFSWCTSYDHIIKAGPNYIWQAKAGCFAQTPLNAVSCDGISQFLGASETDPRWLIITARQSLHHKGWHGLINAFSGGNKILPPLQALHRKSLN
jgi:hypothetical protein